MELKNGIKTFQPKDRKAWRNWLQKNGEKEKSLWLILFRKDSGKKTITYEAAVEEALCFGWIDSKANKRDEESFYLSFAQRNPKSRWSKVNKERIERLTEQKLMTQKGLESIEVAKKNGAWDALNEVEELTVPQDLQKLLSKNKKAKANFGSFPPSAKKAILDWISSAKKEETRKKRVEETIALAEKNIRANQWQPK